MALRFKINKAAYDKLSDDMKNEYVAGESDGEFVLDVTDLPQGEDVGPIKRALEKEKNTAKDLKRQLDEAKNAISEFPDVNKMKADHEAEVGKYKKFTETTLRDGKAMELATKISTVPSLLAKTISDRIIVDMSGDEPVAKIKGADGKASDMTFDNLREEIVANKDFAPILIGSKGSGGGSPKSGTKPLGGGTPKVGEQGDKPVDLSRLSGKDLATRLSEQRAEREANANA